MTEDEAVSIGADVDVRALMAQIRDEVRRKREAGLYPPDVLAELDLVHGGPGPDAAELRAALGDLIRAARFSPDVPTASRKPYVAPLVAGTKRAIVTGVRWYMNAVLQQVNVFAGTVVHATRLVTERIGRMEAEIAALREEVAALRDELSKRE